MELGGERPWGLAIVTDPWIISMTSARGCERYIQKPVPLASYPQTRVEWRRLFRVQRACG